MLLAILHTDDIGYTVIGIDYRPGTGIGNFRLFIHTLIFPGYFSLFVINLGLYVTHMLDFNTVFLNDEVTQIGE